MAKAKALTTEQILRLPAVVDIATAGAAFGIGRSKAHELVQHNQFPCQVLPLGKSYKVTQAAICAVLGIEIPAPAAALNAQDAAA